MLSRLEPWAIVGLAALEVVGRERTLPRDEARAVRLGRLLVEPHDDAELEVVHVEDMARRDLRAQYCQSGVRTHAALVLLRDHLAPGCRRHAGVSVEAARDSKHLAEPW